MNAPLDRLPDPLPIRPLSRPFDAAITPPGSKSLTNRALVLAALADGPSELQRPLVDADDAEVMLNALADLGAVMFQDDNVLQVGGCGGRWQPDPDKAELTLHLGNSGTSTRFLASAALFSPVPVVIDGDARMRQRPIGELAAALRTLGAGVTHLARDGCPPIRIVPPRTLPHAPTLVFPTTLSSQVISGLLLVAPWVPGGLTIRLEGDVTSRSYIAMTAGLLERLGASVRTTDDLRTIRVSSGQQPKANSQQPALGIPPFTYAIEPDASGATYFWAAAALSQGSTCRIEGLDEHSLQGDAAFPSLLAQMGAEARSESGATLCRGTGSLTPITADLSDMPDAAMTLAVVAAFAPGRTIIRGLRTLRVKESDRIAALQAELGKIGVVVESGVLGDAGAIAINPPTAGVDCSQSAPPVYFETYRDHRMAMALSLVGLRRPNVHIRDPRCVGKTYPQFWRDLASLHRA